MQVAQEYLGEVDERITRMATALPGGLGLRGGTCGILVGALGAIGLKYGSVKRSERQLCGNLSLRVYDFFQELTRKKYGTINCRDISHCDFTKPEEASAFPAAGYSVVRASAARRPGASKITTDLSNSWSPKAGRSKAVCGAVSSAAKSSV